MKVSLQFLQLLHQRVSFFCFICFLLVVLKILAKFLYFRRNCWWVFLKCRVCSHEVAAVSESHYQNRFESLNLLPHLLLLLCPVLFVCWFWGLWNFRGYTISGRPMKKFESRYTVETVFDGSKLVIEPLYSVQVLPSGELSIFKMFNCCFYYLFLLRNRTFI